MHTFTTLAVPCAVPGNLASGPVGGVQAKLTSTPVATAIKYKIRYRQTGGSWITIPKGGALGHHWLTGLAYATTYQWQIRTLCQFGNVTGTPWSSMQTFTTAPTPKTVHEASGNLQEAERQLRLMPNPARHQLTIAATGLSGTTAELRVLDLLGKVVHLETLSLQQGRATRQLTLNSRWGAGMYVVVLTDATKSTVGRLEVLRE